MSKDVLLYINGRWTNSSDGAFRSIENPCDGTVLGRFAVATTEDLEAAVNAAREAFESWRLVSPHERAKILVRASSLLIDRAEAIGTVMSREHGKPALQGAEEVRRAAENIQWLAEEGRRTYGRIIPTRAPQVEQSVVQVPLGVVAGFSPWNFPVNQAARKIGAALAAGCTIILKGPEDTPASPAELVRAFHDAGLPAGVLNLVYGNPPEISDYLIRHPVVRKISFTGSTAVGKQLGALAGQYMKRATMELGGHSPVIIAGDADIDAAVKTLVTAKFRNAGQICTSPTRFIIHKSVFDGFVTKFADAVATLKVGDTRNPEVGVGPLISSRRLEQFSKVVADAVDQGARVHVGGKRLDLPGYFYAPTVLSNLNESMRIMQEEPFGPVALMLSYDDPSDAIAEANRTTYGLAAYAWTTSLSFMHRVRTEVECGMISINHMGFGNPETPIGGVKDSGYGCEGGSEALLNYMNPKFVSIRYE